MGRGPLSTSCTYTPGERYSGIGYSFQLRRAPGTARTTVNDARVGWHADPPAIGWTSQAHKTSPLTPRHHTHHGTKGPDEHSVRVIDEIARSPACMMMADIT